MSNTDTLLIAAHTDPAALEAVAPWLDNRAATISRGLTSGPGLEDAKQGGLEAAVQAIRTGKVATAPAPSQYVSKAMRWGALAAISNHHVVPSASRAEFAREVKRHGSVANVVAAARRGETRLAVETVIMLAAAIATPEDVDDLDVARLTGGHEVGNRVEMVRAALRDALSEEGAAVMALLFGIRHPLDRYREMAEVPMEGPLTEADVARLFRVAGAHSARSRAAVNRRRAEATVALRLHLEGAGL